MHRSGTSSVSRAMNLFGVHLGDPARLQGAADDNAEGFWEHKDICDLQDRVLAALQRRWDTAVPLPEGWQKSAAVLPFKDKIKKLVKTNFSGQALWGWKDPRTCLLVPLWREVLAELEVELQCLFVLRNPVDVASSLVRREPIDFGRALGVWFNYCITALKGTEGLPLVFLSYERFLESWPKELRRCTEGLGLNWPENEAEFAAAMNAFVQPGLRSNKSSPARLQSAPHPVRELYELLLNATEARWLRDCRFNDAVDRLAGDFRAYATFFARELETPVYPVSHEAPYFKRTLRRWRRSFQKRFGRRARPNSPYLPDHAAENT